MASRLNLQTMLEKLLGSRNVYFDPPPSVKMKYPAIRYTRSALKKVYANNTVYKTRNPYELTLIDENPDSPIFDLIVALPYCEHTRHYKADNLNHDVFTLYY